MSNKAFLIVSALVVVGTLTAATSLSSNTSSVSSANSSPTISTSSTHNQTSQPQEISNFTLTSIDGKVVDNHHFGGKPTLLKLGSTTCHVCQQEIPEMKQAQKDLGDSANLVFVLIGASQSQAKSYQQKYSINYPIYTDQGSTARLFNVLGTPTHAFLTSDGQLATRQVGFLSSSQITSSLQQLL